ncbi:hypothetical protein KAR28_00245 [Candidatus Parcubacteria bacterium]|nr:hypothetical protein [Candidatus Parcubacteria bacterium]
MSLKFWINMRPGALETGAFRAMLVFIVVLAALTFAFYFFKKQKQFGFYKKIFDRLNNLCLANTIIGLFLIFFIFEQLPFLAMRIWLLVWVIGILAWLGFIINAMLKIPKIKQDKAKEQDYQKYIP